MAGIGPEFLQQLKGIEWDGLTAGDAVALRVALQEAVGKSDEWFMQLTRDFGGQGNGTLSRATSMPKVEDGRPAPAQSKTLLPPTRHPAGAAGVTKPPAVKRQRGRPRKVQPVPAGPNPLVVGGANAEVQETAVPARLFANSYLSKDGPRSDIPAALPPDHPRLNHHQRESSVTAEQDAQDFAAVEKAMATGRGVKDIFQVR